MNREEAIMTIMSYEKDFKEAGNKISIDLFRKYNDAKYFLAIDGLKQQETNNGAYNSNTRRCR